VRNARFLAPAALLATAVAAGTATDIPRARVDRMQGVIGPNVCGCEHCDGLTQPSAT
jgi:hypothetical protein